MKYVNNKIVYEVGDWVVITKECRTGFSQTMQIKRFLNGILDIQVDNRGEIWGDLYDKESVRPATQEEIDKATKEEEIKVGDYLVKFHNYSETCTDKFIEVGCQKVTKDLFLKIGKKANWI